MILEAAVLAFVSLERVSELVIARRNTRRLLAEGAHEAGAGHYPAMVLLHAVWLLGLWLLVWGRPASWPWLMLFFMGQAIRVWVILTLHGRWTTRIIVLPDAPLVKTGPYRLFPHPNYAAVVIEIAALPMAFGLVWYAAVFSALNAGMLVVRIRAERKALALGSAKA